MIRGTTQIAAEAATLYALMQHLHSAFTENSQVEFPEMLLRGISTHNRSLSQRYTPYCAERRLIIVTHI